MPAKQDLVSSACWARARLQRRLGITAGRNKVEAAGGNAEAALAGNKQSSDTQNTILKFLAPAKEQGPSERSRPRV